MFLLLIFLSLAAFGVYLFPEWPLPAILGVSFACVVAFRLILFFTGRSKVVPEANDRP
jgi:hypothetical protein